MNYVTGIDVSRWQDDPKTSKDDVDWVKVKNDPLKPQFVYMRGTIGAGTLDVQFENFYPKARAAGFKVGMYHLIWPPDGVQNEIRDILKQCESKEFDLPVALDVEQQHRLSKVEMRDYLKILCKGLMDAGQRIVIYTGPGFWNAGVAPDDLFRGIDLWNAHYTNASKPLIPSQWSSWKIWQYSSTYKIQGVTANTIDVNRFNGDQAAFDAWLLPTNIQHPIPDGAVSTETRHLLGG